MSIVGKGQRVALKMPFESLSGKIATKQKNIDYSQEVADFEQTKSKVSAKNFAKYIVCTMRNGVNRFYVKSRTSVNNTLANIRQKAALGAAASIAYAMDLLLAGRDPIYYKMVKFIALYNELHSTHKTLITHITSEITKQVRGRHQILSFVYYDGDIIPENRRVYQFQNPFNPGASGDMPPINPAVYAKFYKYLALDTAIKRFKVNGKECVCPDAFSFHDIIVTSPDFNTLGLAEKTEDETTYVVNIDGLYLVDENENKIESSGKPAANYDYSVVE